MYIRRKVFSIVQGENGEEKMFSVKEKQFGRVTDFLKKNGLMKKTLKDRARFAAEDAVKVIKKGGKLTQKEAEKVVETIKENPKAAAGIATGAAVVGSGAVVGAKKLKKDDKKKITDKEFSEGEPEQKEFTSVRKAKKFLGNLAKSGKSIEESGRLINQAQRSKIGSVQQVAKTQTKLGPTIVDPKTGMKKINLLKNTVTKKEFVPNSKSLPRGAAKNLAGKIQTLRDNMPGVQKRNVKQVASGAFQHKGWESVLI